MFKDLIQIVYEYRQLKEVQAVVKGCIAKDFSY
jgi:hypothetical protein